MTEEMESDSSAVDDIVAKLPRLPDRRNVAILVDPELIMQLADLHPNVIDSFASEYAESEEFDDDTMKSWLDYQVLLSVAKLGKRADLVGAALKAEQERKDRLERYYEQQQALGATGKPPAGQADQGEPRKGLFGGRRA